MQSLVPHQCTTSSPVMVRNRRRARLVLAAVEPSDRKLIATDRKYSRSRRAGTVAVITLPSRVQRTSRSVARARRRSILQTVVAVRVADRQVVQRTVTESSI